MLTSVVQATYNSAQSQRTQPRHRFGPHILSRNGTEAAASLPSLPKFLIANARLEFNLTHSKINQLRISNRERIGVSRFSHPAHPPLFPPQLARRHSSASRVFLIVTPRLEVPATHTKHSTKLISNRYKSPISCPQRFPAKACFRAAIRTVTLFVAHLTHRYARTSIIRSLRCRFLVRGLP